MPEPVGQISRMFDFASSTLVVGAAGTQLRQPLVVVVDGDRKGLLRARLADHVLVEHIHDLLSGFGRMAAAPAAFPPPSSSRMMSLYNSTHSSQMRHAETRDQLARLNFDFCRRRTSNRRIFTVCAPRRQERASAPVVTHAEPRESFTNKCHLENSTAAPNYSPSGHFFAPDRWGLATGINDYFRPSSLPHNNSVGARCRLRVPIDQGAIP